MQTEPNKTELKSAIQDLNLIFARVEKLYRDYAAQHGISYPALIVLMCVAEREDAITQLELSKLWSLPKQTMNHAVAALVKKGWISLTQNRSARTGKSIGLTTDGLSFCREVIFPLFECEFRAFDNFSAGDLRALIDLQKRHCENFERIMNNVLK